MKVTVIPIVISAHRSVTKALVKRLKGLETSGNRPDYNIIKISQNTEKSPGDLYKLAVS